MAGRGWTDLMFGIDRNSMTATQRFARAREALAAAQIAFSAAQSNLIQAQRAYDEESRAFMHEFFGDTAVEKRRERIKEVVNE